MFTKAEAANLTYVKDTLSDSDTGSVSNHTIQFLSPTGVGAGETIVVTFPSEFNLATSGIAFDDIDLAENGVDKTIVAGAPAAAQWGFSTTSNTFTLTAGASESIASNATVTIKVGTNATVGATGDAQVTNPTAIGSYEFTVTAGTADSGQYRVAIVDNVLVTANVNTTLTFTVSGVANGQAVNGSATNTATTTTSTSLPFETLDAGVSKTLAQDLTVATNARNGYVVTVEQDSNLQSSTGADIDGFIDGAYTDTPTAWQAPGNNVNDENTWGHWGLTSDDVSLLGAGSDFGADEWVAASTTPRAIMAHNAPADGVTQNIGKARVGYQAEITALQEAGDDYSTVLTYIATPTF
ncbi:MAG TPA: hypothetical protein VFS75_02680 [Candidatus Paceibacterota bacterium]|nr:hypothetical protein [Candidatus Paceibacterota bacterium]